MEAGKAPAPVAAGGDTAGADVAGGDAAGEDAAGLHAVGGDAGGGDTAEGGGVAWPNSSSTRFVANASPLWAEKATVIASTMQQMTARQTVSIVCFAELALS